VRQVSKKSLFVSEIYSAIQGEGPLLGIRQIFLRLSGCDLRCKWCDTPESLQRSPLCSVEQKMGERNFKMIQNPINYESFISFVNNLVPKLHHSMSITGGEPLLQAELLKTYIIKLKEQFKFPVYLESGGHRHDELSSIIHLLDYVSMDIKIPSSGTAVLWENHKKFLDVCLKSESLIDFWIKLVVSEETLLDELVYAVDLVKSRLINKSPILFLQPVTQINGIKPPTPCNLLNIHKELLSLYPHIRVVPQVHSLISQK